MTDAPQTFRLSQLGTPAPAAGGCGCGCSGDSAAAETVTVEAPAAAVGTQSFGVTGMTCGHCTSSVTQELSALEGVEEVTIDLVADGTSTVHVTGRTLATDEIAAALDEAGGYALA